MEYWGDDYSGGNIVREMVMSPTSILDYSSDSSDRIEEGHTFEVVDDEFPPYNSYPLIIWKVVRVEEGGITCESIYPEEAKVLGKRVFGDSNAVLKLIKDSNLI